MSDFSLRECYVLAEYGLRASISNGKLEGFIREEKKNRVSSIKDRLDHMALAAAQKMFGCGF